MTHPTSRLSNLGWSSFFRSQLTALEMETTRPYRITKIHHQILDLEGDGEPLQISLAGQSFGADLESNPVVGDWVLIDPETRTVVRILSRNSLFRRKLPGKANQVQPMVANIDTLFVVSSANREFNPSRIERYLVLAEDAGAEAVLVLTKVDLVHPEDMEYIMEEARTLKPGLPIVVINGLDGKSVDQLRPWFAPGKTVSLTGSSGVGKSTLVNTLVGEEILATGESRTADHKGRHTTTFRSLHILPGGEVVVDSPGMRELSLPDMKRGIEVVFSDIEDLAAQCRFSDCRHDQEAGCAVLDAVEKGTLDFRRLDSYVKLKEERMLNLAGIEEKREQLQLVEKKSRIYKKSKKHRKRH